MEELPGMYPLRVTVMRCPERENVRALMLTLLELSLVPAEPQAVVPM